ncbi:hypothetical protein EES42_39035 [Streptomyces sp. ADI95-17]|nr:hypothetical protein EES42_39035 [Streptomyces sp. ADI95-17]
MPEIDEKRTKASNSSSPRTSWRWAAPRTFARRTSAYSARLVSSITLSWPTPAACTTAVMRSPASRSPWTVAASASRSATSHAARVTLAPSAVSRSSSSRAPGASAPLRLVSTTCSAPWSVRRCAMNDPRAPVPPVISTVPRGVHRGPAEPWPALARWRRRPKTPDARTATWSSASSPPLSTPQIRVHARSSRVSGRSINPPQRSGCSRATTRPKPQFMACSVRTGPSERPTETALRVRHHSGAWRPASPRALTSSTLAARPAGITGCSRSGPWSSASRDTTPAGSGASASRAARIPRSTSVPETVNTETSAPCRVSPRTVSRTVSWSASTAGTTSSQLPDMAGAAAVTGFQVTR